MYPLFLKLEKSPCLVIGGGIIAERKIIGLLEAGAHITLISPDVTDGLMELIESHSIDYLNRSFKDGDTEGFFLIIAATNSRESNKQVYSEAQRSNSLINCVDDPEYCNFYVPAQVTRGSLKIAVSTEGKLPILARRMRQHLNKMFPKNMGDKLEALGEIRREIIREAGDDDEKKKAMMKEQLIPSIDAILKDMER